MTYFAALLAAGAFIFSSGTLALVSAFNPSYVEQRWHVVLVYIAVMLSCFVLNVRQIHKSPHLGESDDDF